MTGLLNVPLNELRARRSAKWTAFPADVLPLHVAEMDVRLAPPVGAALRSAVEASDTGYAGDVAPVTEGFARFAHGRWRWTVDPDMIRTCADVAAGVTEVLRMLVAPGDDVVVASPVYSPVWSWLRAVGARAVNVPLLDGKLDLDGIERALAGGVRVLLLCSPENPTGRVHGEEELRALAALAARHDARVLVDEIHAPLTLPGHTFHPYLAVSEEAAATGIAFHSASKAWNLAGLKTALIVTGHPRQRALLDALPHEVPWSVGHLGVLAGAAAYADGGAWLDDLLVELAGNVALLVELLARELPEIELAAPQATYLAWLDCRRLELGADPTRAFLRSGVALSAGPGYGPGGLGFARLNFACSPELLREAVSRMRGVRDRFTA